MKDSLMINMDNRQPIKWIRADAYCRYTGDTKHAIYARCQRGEWLLGNHYIKRVELLEIDNQTFDWNSLKL